MPVQSVSYSKGVLCSYLIETLCTVKCHLSEQLNLSCQDRKIGHGHLDIFCTIIDNVTNRNPADNNGFTALHFAVHKKHFNVCKYILQVIEDKHPENVFLQTPLQLAIKNKYSQVVRLYEQVEKRVYNKISDTYDVPNRGKGSYENLEWTNSF